MRQRNAKDKEKKISENNKGYIDFTLNACFRTQMPLAFSVIFKTGNLVSFYGFF